MGLITTHRSFPSVFSASAAIVLAGLLAVLFVCFAIHRLYLHPLAKYPGPLLARLTSWWDVYYAYRGDKHILMHQLHQKYGNIVRYGPNTLSINHPTALQAIYAHGANVRKSDFYLSFLAIPGAFSTHTAIDTKVHARKRRVMSHAFSDSALKGVEDFVLLHVSRFLGALTDSGKMLTQASEQWSRPKNMAHWSTYLGFDVMGDLSFGRDFHMLTGETIENRRAPELLMQAAKRHNTTGPLPWLHESGFDRILFRKMNLDRDRYLAFSRGQVQERVASRDPDSKRKDFFYYLLNSKDPITGEGFAAKELWGESNTLIIAGSDTTSTTLTSTIFYLMHNESALSRLQTEIRSSFSSLEDIRTGPTLSGCKYLRACIDEALRMSPPVAAVLPRFTLAGGINVLGEHIPAGVGVGSPIYALHHNPEFVSRPFDYDPSRWMADERDETEYQNLQSVFNPFSVGSRGCIGKPMAYMELSLAIARMVWKYDMRLAEGELGHVGEGRPGLGQGRERPSEFQMWDKFVGDKDGPWVQFRMRPEQLVESQ